MSGTATFRCEHFEQTTSTNTDLDVNNIRVQHSGWSCHYQTRVCPQRILRTNYI